MKAIELNHDTATRKAYIRGAWEALARRGPTVDVVRKVFDDLGVTGEEIAALAVELRAECAAEIATRDAWTDIGLGGVHET